MASGLAAAETEPEPAEVETAEEIGPVPPTAGSPGSEYETPTADLETDSEVERSIETITILGSRSETRYLPGSGQVLDTQTIRAQSNDDIGRILSQVPGVYVRQEDGNGLFPNVSMRGVDTTRSAKVTVMMDGILAAPAPYSSPAAYFSPNAARMSSIEVLKGSSQIRFGPHTTGGVLNYITTPITDNFESYGKALYGDFNEAQIHLYTGGMMEETRFGQFGFVAEAYLRRSDGFMTIDPTTGAPDPGNTGFTTVEPMLKFAWEPPTQQYQRLELMFGYTYSDARETYLGKSEADFSADPLARYSTTRFADVDRQHYRASLNHTTQWPEESFLGGTELTTRGYYTYFERDWFKAQAIKSIDTTGDGIPNFNEPIGLARALANSGVPIAPDSPDSVPGTIGMPLELLRGQRAGELFLQSNDRQYTTMGLEQTAQIPFQTGEFLHEVTTGWRYHFDAIRRLQRLDIYDFSTNGANTGRTIGQDGSGGNNYEDTSALALYLEDEIIFGDFS
ncbi:TonB-dependent receptor plug domain-containing protein, partial [Myxococcota bacterium]|nr:TonB-dependent receptor plug domain-containing protein [Myxococcota bacterium]